MKPRINDSRPLHFRQILQHAYSTAPPPATIFLVLLTVLLNDVDHWECLSDDTDARLRFDVWWRMNYDGNGRWMGRGSLRPQTDSADQI